MKQKKVDKRFIVIWLLDELDVYFAWASLLPGATYSLHHCYPELQHL
jgi:hypothetical protein